MNAKSPKMPLMKKLFAVPMLLAATGVFGQQAVCLTSTSDNFFPGSGTVHVTQVGDFNADGIPDMISAISNIDKLELRLGNGEGGFSAPISFNTGDQPRSMALGDFNSDGKLDVIAVHQTSNNLGVFLGDGSGGFSAPAFIATSVSQSSSVAAADFNADGKLDVVATGEASNNLTVFIGNGLGGFAAPLFIGAAVGPRHVITSDFNNDGKIDLAVANNGGGSVSIFLGNGSGGFGAPTSIATGSTSLSVTAGDFNVDGKIDLAVSNQGSSTTSILLGNGAGGFAAGTPLTTTTPSYVQSTDLNNDGKTDLLVVHLTMSSVSAFLGLGNGSFTAVGAFATAGTPLHLVVSDLNIDGYKDAVVSSTNGAGVTAVLGNGNGTFLAPTTFPTGTNPNAAFIADFNGDGKPDLAVTNQTATNVSVMLGNGAGSMGAAVNYTVGNIPTGVAGADFNGDGAVDLAVCNASSNSVSILLSNGPGTFAAAVSFATGSNPLGIATADFNGDGKADVVTSNSGSNNVSILLGNGAGSLGAPTHFAVGTTPRAVLVGDFNGDGKVDLATPNQASANVSVLMGNGSGGFSATGPYTVGASGINSIVGADFNGDGHGDIAVGNGVTSLAQVLLNNGTGGFGAAVGYSVGLTPLSLVAADFNGDGKVDLASRSNPEGNVLIAIGNGAGAFAAPISYSTTFGQRISSGDFNLDGKPDLVALGFSNHRIMIMLNETATVLPAGPTTICVGQSATLNASGGYAFAWSPGGANTQAFDATTSGLYSVTITNQTGTCSTTSNQIQLTVNQAPAQPGPITGDGEICVNTNETYTIATVPGATAYAWSLPGGWAGTSTSSSITATAGNTGNISVTASNACGTSPAATLAIAVNNSVPQISSGVTGLSVVCVGASTTYAIDAVADALSYTWTLPGSWAGTSTSATISTTAGSTGGDVVVIAHNACGGSIPVSIPVTVYTSVPNTPGPISGHNAICAGSTNVFEIAAVPTSTSYLWSLPVGWTGNSTSPSVQSVSAASSGDVEVVAVNACGQSGPATLTVSVTATVPPAPAVIDGLLAVCEGSEQNYSVDAVPGATLYAWTVGDGWEGTSSSNTISVVAGASSESISVAAVNICGAGTGATQLITVTRAPSQPGAIMGADAVCVNSAGQYSIAEVPGAERYQWTVPAGWTGTSTTSGININAGATGGQIAVEAVNECGTSASRSLLVSIVSVPKPEITVNNANPAAPVLSSNATSGNQWFLNGEPISGAIGSSYTATSQGSYQVQVTTSGCTSMLSNASAIIITGLLAERGMLLPLLYPNPVEQELTVHLAGFDADHTVQVNVMDAFGREVQRHTARGESQIQLDVGRFASGFYFIRMTQGLVYHQLRFVRK